MCFPGSLKCTLLRRRKSFIHLQTSPFNWDLRFIKERSVSLAFSTWGDVLEEVFSVLFQKLISLPCWRGFLLSIRPPTECCKFIIGIFSFPTEFLQAFFLKSRLCTLTTYSNLTTPRSFWVLIINPFLSQPLLFINFDQFHVYKTT